MATGYPGGSSSDKKNQPPLREEKDDSSAKEKKKKTAKGRSGRTSNSPKMMSVGPRDFPVDMSVAPRPDPLPLPRPHELTVPHRYTMPLAAAAAAAAAGHDRSYFSTLYANNLLSAHSTGAALAQQSFYASQQRHHLSIPEAQQRQLRSPTSPPTLQLQQQLQHQQQQQQQQQPHPHPHQQQQQQQQQPQPRHHQRKPSTSQHQLQRPSPPPPSIAGVSPDHHPSAEDVVNFKFKNSSGKLVMMDILGSESTSLDLLPLSGHQRAKREFVPDNRKDESYWNKRLKNNDSARRSRVKRKAIEKLMESRLSNLQKENIELKHEMRALKRRFGLPVPEDELSLATSSGLRVASPSATSTITSPTESAAAIAATGSAVRDTTTPTSPEEQRLATLYSTTRDEELERESAGSDDSQTNDDSRVHQLSSMSVLNHSLGLGGLIARDRTDSFGSGTSSRPESRSSQLYQSEYHSVRTDKMGALDLTSSDNSNRSTPARELSLTPEAFSGGNVSSFSVASSGQKSSNKSVSQTSVSSLLGEMDMEDKKSSSGAAVGGQEMRGVPLKYRWKREMQSAGHTTSPPAPSSSNPHSNSASPE